MAVAASFSFFDDAATVTVNYDTLSLAIQSADIQNGTDSTLTFAATDTAALQTASTAATDPKSDSTWT